MAKLTLTDISAGYLSIATYNANNTLIETALENTLSRDGTTPNTMSANLDLNSNKVVNLADATNNQDAVTLAQLNAASIADGSIAAASVTLADAGANYAATTAEAAFAELASTANGEGASIIGIEDSGGLITATTVEGALAEIAGAASWADGDTGHYLDDLEIRDATTTIQLTESDQSAELSDWSIYASGQLLFVGSTSSAGAQSAFERYERSNQTANGKTYYVQQNFNDQNVIRPVLKDFGIHTTAGSSSSGAITFALTTSNSYTVTLDENITAITLTGPPASGTLGELIIKFNNGASYTVAGWPASVKWPSGTAPTITTGAGAIDIITLKTWDGGTNWYGNFSQDYS